MNTVVISGNLGKDPELRYTTNGMAVCDVSVAVNNYFKENGEVKKKTAWIMVRAFGKTAEAISINLEKGNKIVASGKLDQDKWEKDGKTFTTIRIIANEVTFCSTKNKPEGESGEFEDTEPF